MQSGTSHSGHRPHGRRTAPPPFPGFQSAVIRVHLRRSLGFQLSTVDSDRRAQPPCFDNLPHSSTTAQTSPLCFHNLTNSFFRNPFPLITIQNPWGCHPLDGAKLANSFPFNRSLSFRCRFPFHYCAAADSAATHLDERPAERYNASPPMSSSPELSIVIPAVNEERRLPETLDKVHQYLMD